MKINFINTTECDVEPEYSAFFQETSKYENYGKQNWY